MMNLQRLSIVLLPVAIWLVPAGSALAASTSAQVNFDAPSNPVIQVDKQGADLQDDTYHPPDNGGPDSTQGSGTR